MLIKWKMELVECRKYSESFHDIFAKNITNRLVSIFSLGVFGDDSNYFFFRVFRKLKDEKLKRKDRNKVSN